MRRRLRPWALLAVVPLLLAACGDDDEPTSAADPAATAAATGPPCVYAEAESPAKDVAAPPDRAAVGGMVEVTLETTVGELDLTLDAERSPCTVNSFVSLARQGYFDDTTCHRMTISGIYVLQCGDPSATGTGGPGYTIEDEVDGSETYPAGTLAMAKTQLPDSGGSQFFIVYDDTSLPPSYTVFGTVSQATVGLLQDVAADGVDDANGPGDGHPNTEVRIESASVAD
ncbi:peptidylprolyl isomerase [Nocardioides ferulae]|uniref:peptidylprolyl isomerase n=1 Tax=Nocardioides ferulae TaxID=2340821 RepID=UPI000EAE058C|nr:peptidylprolyl isomerase [Nocardioides ferulae]